MNALKREQLRHDLEAAGVFLHDQHIVLRCGLHARDYAKFTSANVPRVLRGRLLSWIVQAVMPHLTKDDHESVVFAGLGSGYWYAAQVAEMLGGLPSVYAEYNLGGRLVFQKDQGVLLENRKVILVDDVIITGSTACELASLVCTYGGTVLDFYAFLLGGENATCPVPRGYRALFKEPMQIWKREVCPLCKDKKPFSIQHGAGAEQFLRYGQP